jgi:hypothetical protein
MPTHCNRIGRAVVRDRHYMNIGFIVLMQYNYAIAPGIGFLSLL